MRRAAVAAAGYLAVTAVMASPLVDFRHLRDATYEGDARLLVWTLAWDARALLGGRPLFDANIYFPEPNALRYAEHHLGIGLFATPVYAVSGNPVLTYWILWLAAFPLNAAAMHALAVRITGRHHGGLAAGLVFAFCFFRMHHGHGHIQLLWTWMLPLVPLALERWLQRPTPAKSAAAAALVALTALTSGYLAVFVAVLAVVSVIVLAPGVRITRAHVWQALAASAAGILIVGALTRPYLGLAAGPAAEAAANSADLRAYLLPPENTVLGQLLMRRTSLVPRWIWGEQTLYVGFSVLVLSAAGLVRFVTPWQGRERERRLAAAVLATGCVALALSFGPSRLGASPFDLLSALPGLGLLRAPGRFALLVTMATALLSGLGAVRLEEQWRLRGRALAAVLLALFLVESFVVRFPGGKPRVLAVPAPYRMLAALPPGGVLSLPSYRGTAEAFRETDYLLFSTSHWRPIVNGFGRQEPPDHARRISILSTFPSRAAVESMRRLGVRYVVVHAACDTAFASRVQEAGATPPRNTSGEAAVRLVHSADGVSLFEVR